MNLPYRWVIVGAGALMTCVAFGTVFSLAIFQEPIAADTHWSYAGIASAMTLNFLVGGAGGFLWGTVTDRFGPRIVVLIGAVLMGLALILASRTESLLVFQLSFGVLIGLAGSTFFTPMIVTTIAWFDTQRSLAVSLVSAGMGVAPLTISPFARWLITAYDWRTAMLVIGIGAMALLIPAALARPPPTGSGRRPRRFGRCRRRRRRHVAAPGLSLAAVPGPRLHLLRLLRGPFGTDFPHGQLRHGVRHHADGGGQHLQRRGSGGARRPPPVRRPRRPAGRQARARRRPR